MNSSSLTIAVARSSIRASSAPRAGSCGVDREAQAGVRAGAPDELGDAAELVHELGEPGGVELADATPVRGERAGTLLRLVEQLVDARVALAVDERLDVPRDVGGGAVVVVDGHGVVGHVARAYDAATGRDRSGVVDRDAERLGQRLRVHARRDAASRG